MVNPDRVREELELNLSNRRLRLRKTGILLDVPQTPGNATLRNATVDLPWAKASPQGGYQEQVDGGGPNGGKRLAAPAIWMNLKRQQVRGGGGMQVYTA